MSNDHPGHEMEEIFRDQLDALKERIQKVGRDGSDSPEYREAILKLTRDVVTHPLWKYTIKVDSRLMGGSQKDAERDAFDIDAMITVNAAKAAKGTISNKESNTLEEDLMDAQHEMRVVIGQSHNVALMAEAGILPDALSTLYMGWREITKPV